MKKIYAICTTLDAGCNNDRKDILASGMVVGDKIELRNAEVGTWYTNVYLVGYEKSFNSVFFKFVDENGEKYDIYNDKDFQTYW